MKSNEYTDVTLAAMDKYIKQMCEKLSDPLKAPKYYWKILNRLLSNKNVPAIPPLLINGEISPNLKVAIFNYVALQGTPL